ncbi:MAG: hypothetical protein ACRCVN_06750 [Spirochaetia bacterium]
MNKVSLGIFILFFVAIFPSVAQEGEFVFGETQQGQLRLISHGSYVLPKSNQRYISLRVRIKNVAKNDQSLSGKSLIIGQKKQYFFDLKNGDRVYTVRPKKTQIQGLSPGQEYIFTLDFVVDASDPMANFILQYAPKSGPQVRDQQLALGHFFAQGPADTQTMGRYGYFSVLDYYIGEEGKNKKRRLTLRLKLGNDRDYSSYFSTGFLPNAMLVYAGQHYYFEMNDGSNRMYIPIDIVPARSNERTGKQSGKSTETQLIPSDVREITLNFMLDADVQLSKLQLRFKDPHGYIAPSEWLDLAQYMQQVPPIPVRLKIRPAAEKLAE